MLHSDGPVRVFRGWFTWNSHAQLKFWNELSLSLKQDADSTKRYFDCRADVGRARADGEGPPFEFIFAC